MASHLSWEEEADGEATRLRMRGEITEGADLPRSHRSNASIVILDLEGIQRINSSGVREWIDFVAGLAKQGREIVLDRCSVAIVHQLNMVSNFTAGAKVRSVFAPYVCDECNSEEAHLMVLEGRGSLSAKPVDCRTCGNPMEFDDLPDAYFAFDRVSGF
jgi:ABC-type transporter Mla MlaB component